MYFILRSNINLLTCVNILTQCSVQNLQSEFQFALSVFWKGILMSISNYKTDYGTIKNILYINYFELGKHLNS